ncbi:hypothetical protein BCR34DRAFT_556454 [Clohesyomyces aquaticus]|uniref:Heterokaryon incompatibility domain-containing protein n=1 Tax=Clohesyomyces aquaticus TaxID=1231657 RepID=A0A1Y2A2M1_9PLEO|nr:hypothetical protein BCR34DRAFT_556454 [Clohesyomyces aquaticus]
MHRILQDSDDDKYREISMMQRIYEGAYISIVAASSSSAAQRLLQPRKGTGKLYPIPFRLSPDNFGTIFVQNVKDVFHDESNEPISKRAWTLQEQLKSRRQIIYSSHTLQWRCNSGMRNLGDSLCTFDRSNSLLRRLHEISQAAPNIQSGIQRWNSIADVYSGRTASLPCDKLNAISSMADSFSKSLSSQYYAGLWHHDLLQSLLRSTSRGNSRLKVYRVPSWSWTSIDGPVFHPSGYPLFRCELVDCNVQLKSAKLPFCEVTSGSLKIKAVMRKAWFWPAKHNLSLVAEDNEDVDAGKTVHSPFVTKTGPPVGFHDEPFAKRKA